MPSNIYKNSKISQFTTKLKIYGIRWSIVFILIAIKRYFVNNLILGSYSQYGEDLIISKLLKNKKKITYIDIGSNHPVKFNNTYRFYKSGSHGLIVEPNSRLSALHHQIRPLDICENIGASNQKGHLTFYEFYPDVASTVSKMESIVRQKTGAILIAKSKIQADTLESIIEKDLNGLHIDLLSVDTEGHDMEVLMGNNWQKVRPSIICVESLDKNNVHQYLTDLKYKRVFQNSINSIYETISG